MKRLLLVAPTLVAATLVAAAALWAHAVAPARALERAGARLLVPVGPAATSSAAPKKTAKSERKPATTPGKGPAKAPAKGAKKEPGKTVAKKPTPPPPPALSWPVSGRTIIEPYGERINPQTRTVTLNPGINIAARKGSDVRASAAGKISLVSWLPSYGTFVIVEHRDGYRTVYANLASTTVARGRAVGLGSRLGTVGESARGAFVHFEVWRNQTRLDPRPLLP
jgi:murein DD-endopeptidase MepM/ murein hydrolase activator NlpD